MYRFCGVTVFPANSIGSCTAKALVWIMLLRLHGRSEVIRVLTKATDGKETAKKESQSHQEEHVGQKRVDRQEGNDDRVVGREVAAVQSAMRGLTKV